MEYLIGVILGLTVAGLGTVVGFARERAFYPTLPLSSPHIMCCLLVLVGWAVFYPIPSLFFFFPFSSST